LASRHLFLAAALALLVAAPAGGAAAGSGFGIRISPLANLIYHLDCLSGYRRCTREAYDTLWQELGWSARDEERIARWRALQERYRIYADFTEPGRPSPYPYTFPYLQARGVDVGEKLRIASLQAGDLADYRERLGLLLQPGDARDAAAIAAHFRPRFDEWWTQGPAADLERLAAGYRGVAERAGLRELLTGVAALFDVRMREVEDLQVDLIALPERATGSQATVVENHAIVESRRGESPADRLGVVIHEFVHYLYAQSPAERHEAMLAAFVRSERPWSLRAYNLINEAIASAIGNGIAEQRLQSEREYLRYAALPDSFYADYYVDTLAKALVPVMERRLATREPLGPGFAAEYLATADRALGDRLDDLPLQLISSAIVATDPVLADLARRPASTLTTFSLFTHVTETPGLAETALARYAELSGIVLILKEDLPRLAGFVDEDLIGLMQGLGERIPAFVYGRARSPRATVYFVAGEDRAAVARALDHLLSRSTSFTGLSLPPERASAYPASDSSETISNRIPMPRSRSSSASPMASAGVSTP
jgi:hypothetical protein